jgi:hypothetical protein
MAKPPGAIGKKKREAAKQRRLDRGQKKLAAKQARHAKKAHKQSTPPEETP